MERAEWWLQWWKKHGRAVGSNAMLRGEMLNYTTIKVESMTLFIENTWCHSGLYTLIGRKF